MSHFREKVYNLVKTIPKGKVSTYKNIAHALNSTAYRAVGQAMRHSPGMPKVPCHRVIASNGTIGGFNGQTKGKDIKRKLALLKKEGVKFKHGKIQDNRKIIILFY